MARTAYWIFNLSADWPGDGVTGAQIAAGNLSDNSAADFAGSEAFSATSGTGTITEATAITLSTSTAYTIAWVVYDDVALTYSNVVTGEITTSAASIAGVLSATLGAASLAATGQIAIAGALSKSLDSAVVTAAGFLGISGALSGALGAATLSSASTLALSGALSSTLAGATLSAAGESSAPGTGSLAVTLSDAGLSAAGVLYLSGALSETLGDASLSSAGALAIDGELTATLDDASLSAQGEQLLPINGVLTATLEDATLEAYENEPVSSGILEIEWEPNLWWKRKPKALPEKVAREKLKKAATVIAKKAEEQVKADVVAEKEQRKAEAREAVRPMLAEMPGFDWQALYDEAYSRALNAAVAQAMREQEAMAQAKAAIDRARLLDDEDVEILMALL